LRVTAHQRQPRQFAFGYAGFGGHKRIEADAVTPVGEVTTTNVFFQRVDCNRISYRECLFGRDNFMQPAPSL
jgi:hypothetical protein